MNERIITPPHSVCMNEWALFYASIGFKIIPLYEPDLNGQCSCKNNACSSIGKHPRVKNGLKDASCDTSLVQKWWGKWPRANIGLVTGTSSGKIVIDVDPKNGGIVSLQSLEATHGPLQGKKVFTGSGGFHFYYSVDDSQAISNKVNLMPGIDIRGEGGYIVAPPSLHKTGLSYSWDNFDEDYPPIPQWLITLCSLSKSSLQKAPKEQTEKKRNTDSSFFIGEGLRNNFLCSIAGSMHKYGLNEKVILNLLIELNYHACFPSLQTKEVEIIAQSVTRYAGAPQELILSWGEIIPVDLMTYCIPKLEIDIVPNVMRSWVLDIAKRMQIPLDLVVIPALISISAVIGKKIRIYPKQFDNWVVHPNLWGALIARPGTLKSPAIAEALKPLENLVKKEHDLFIEKSNQWAIQKTIKIATEEAIKQQIAQCLHQNKKEETELLKEQLTNLQEEMRKSTPTCKRFKTNDATIEKLVELLIENPNGLLLVRDELSGWLTTLNKNGREGEREFWLECWGGKGSYTVDRIGRGTIHASSLCLSVFGAIQPDKLESLVTDPLQSNDDGLLQRFQLIVCPEIEEKWENHDTAPDHIAQKAVEKVIEEIAAFDPRSKEGFIGLRFSQDAQDLFNTWREKLENSLRKKEWDCAAYEAHLSKYRSLIPSLALVFEILDTGCYAKEVSQDALQKAIAWSDYLIKHAKKIYRIDQYQRDNASHQSFLKKLSEKKIYDGMSIRHFSRVSWEHLKTKDQIESTLEFYAQHNWIQIVENKTLGRPSRIIKINPALLSH